MRRIDTYKDEVRYLDIHDIGIRLNQIICTFDIVLEDTHKCICATEKVLEPFGISELATSLKDNTDALVMIKNNAIDLLDECRALEEKEYEIEKALSQLDE